MVGVRAWLNEMISVADLGLASLLQNQTEQAKTGGAQNSNTSILILKEERYPKDEKCKYIHVCLAILRIILAVPGSFSLLVVLALLSVYQLSSTFIDSHPLTIPNPRNKGHEYMYLETAGLLRCGDGLISGMSGMNNAS